MSRGTRRRLLAGAALVGLDVCGPRSAGADEPPPVLMGRIRWPGVTGAAMVRGGRALLVGSGGLLLLSEVRGRLPTGDVNPTGEERLPLKWRSPGEIDDLQDAAWDGTGHAYVVASHARTPLGEAPEGRYRIGRLHLDATGRVLSAQHSDALLRGIVENVPFLADAIRRTPARSGLNVEGLAWSPEGHLLVGLRAPTVTESRPRPHGGQEDAVVLRVRNPADLFSGQPADLADTVKLDLRGQGIRGIAFDPARRCWWLLSGLSPALTHPATAPWGLWRWDGRGEPVPVPLPSAVELREPTAVAVAEDPPADRLLLVEPGKEESRYALLAVPALH